MEENNIKTLLKNVLSENAFFLVNKTLVKKIGIEATVFLEAIRQKSEYNNSDWVFFQRKLINENLALSSFQQRRIIQILKKYNLVETKLFDSPAKLHYKINYKAVLDILVDTTEEKHCQDANNSQMLKNLTTSSKETSLLDVKKLNNKMLRNLTTSIYKNTNNKNTNKNTYIYVHKNENENETKETHALVNCQGKEKLNTDIENIKKIFLVKGGTEEDAEDFHNYYTMVGWTVGRAGKKMKSIECAVALWLRNKIRFMSKDEKKETIKKEEEDKKQKNFHLLRKKIEENEQKKLLQNIQKLKILNEFKKDNEEKYKTMVEEERNKILDKYPKLPLVEAQKIAQKRVDDYITNLKHHEQTTT